MLPSLPVRLCCCCRWVTTTTGGGGAPPLPPEEEGGVAEDEVLGCCSLTGAEAEKSAEESPPLESPVPLPPATRKEVPPVSDIASDMLSHLGGAPPPVLRARRRGVGAANGAGAPAVFSSASSGEEPVAEALMSGEYAGGGVPDGSRRGEYAGPLTTATTTGVRPAAAATLAGEVEEAAEDAGLSFASATPMSLEVSWRCCRVGVRVEVAAITAAPVAAAAPAAGATVAFAVVAPPAADDHSCEASWTGGSGGTGRVRHLRGEDSGDSSNESVLGLLLAIDTPKRLDPPGLLVLVALLLVDVGWPVLLP